MNDTSGPSKKRKAEEIAENGDDDRTGVTAPGEHDEITAGKAQVSKADCESKGNQENSTKSNDGDVEMKDAAKNKESGSGPTIEASSAGQVKAAEKVEAPKAAPDEEKGGPLLRPVLLSGPDEEKGGPLVNAYDKLKWIVVKNDGTPSNMIKLVGLKRLFAKQLPKMPRAYIARLVFDKRHISLAILSEDPAVKDSDEEIIGGICFRPFQDMRFAEIAFCAVSSTHQVKVCNHFTWASFQMSAERSLF